MIANGIKIAFVIMLAAIPAYSSASFTYIPIVIQRKEVWNVEKDTPFAVWEAISQTVPGSEVVIGRKGGVIDKAALLPQSVYAVDQDFVGNDSLLLPKGGLLVKMAGGDGKWYCTWKYGDHASAIATDVWEKRELCLQAEPGKPISDATLEVSLYPEMLTILPSVVTKRIKNYNLVNLHSVENSLLPSRSELQVHAKWKEANGGSVCLSYTMKPLFGPESCFKSIGKSLEVMGGSYTLLSINADRTARIKIDRAINVSDIRPILRSH